MNNKLVRTLAFVALVGMVFAASCATFVNAEMPAVSITGAP